jgi:hypothetical protein
VMPMFSAGDVQKRPEAALLRVIKTFVDTEGGSGRRQISSFAS